MRHCAAALAACLLISAPALACGCPYLSAIDAVAMGDNLRVFSARVVSIHENRWLGGVAVLEVDRVWTGTLFKHAPENP